MVEPASQATFRFYAELNDFLPAGLRYRDLPFRFSTPGSVKDAIESLGVPHTEVDLVLANGEPVPFEYRLQPGDRISVYPMFESLDIGGTTRCRAEPLRDPQFVLDVHLGKLARQLRMAGFDSRWSAAWDDHRLAGISQDEHRLLLTRDVGLLKHSAVTHGYWVRSQKPAQQFLEVLRRFDLAGKARPFTRCMECNGELREAEPADVAGRAPDRVRAQHSRFLQCPQCGRVYWPGTHWARMQDVWNRACRELRGP